MKDTKLSNPSRCLSLFNLFMNFRARTSFTCNPAHRMRYQNTHWARKGYGVVDNPYRRGKSLNLWNLFPWGRAQFFGGEVREMKMSFWDATMRSAIGSSHSHSGVCKHSGPFWCSEALAAGWTARIRFRCWWPSPRGRTGNSCPHRNDQSND